jgi:uncharacterized protein (DUF924 family)
MDMGGDLVANPREVHDDARTVLDFWFGEVREDRWFARDDALDAAISQRFAGLRDAILAEGAQRWRRDPETLLAAVIVLDQFSRNLFRGEAEAFAADPLALELTRCALSSGWDMLLPVGQRAFLYMPLMHAENSDAQVQSVACFTALGQANNLKYARDHAAAIARFGRFPGRNEALGRTSTADEVAFLANGEGGW